MMGFKLIHVSKRVPRRLILLEEHCDIIENRENKNIKQIALNNSKQVKINVLSKTTMAVSGFVG